MGYTTTFTGSFRLDRVMTSEHAAYLRRFSDTRRMKRNPGIASTLPDPFRTAVGLAIGVDGGYYVGNDDGNADQSRDASVMDYNMPPSGQPGLWCAWTVGDDGDTIEWTGQEKFYHYVDWLKYIIEHFLRPWGYVLNGSVRWAGERDDDRGVIYVTDSDVKVKRLVLVESDD
jgi:hypothetical protein